VPQMKRTEERPKPQRGSAAWAAFTSSVRPARPR